MLSINSVFILTKSVNCSVNHFSNQNMNSVCAGLVGWRWGVQILWNLWSRDQWCHLSQIETNNSCVKFNVAVTDGQWDRYLVPQNVFLVTGISVSLRAVRRQEHSVRGNEQPVAVVNPLPWEIWLEGQHQQAASVTCWACQVQSHFEGSGLHRYSSGWNYAGGGYICGAYEDHRTRLSSWFFNLFDYYIDHVQVKKRRLV